MHLLNKQNRETARFLNRFTFGYFLVIYLIKSVFFALNLINNQLVNIYRVNSNFLLRLMDVEKSLESNSILKSF